MGKPVTNITIVGGGTSGWITAAYLNQRLQWNPTTANPDVKITLIESPDISIIGVGEATVPTLKQTLANLNISEAEFIERTDATFKLGIWFRDWNRDADDKPIGYLHPFTGGMTVAGFHPGYAFKHYGIPGKPVYNDQDFVRTISHAREAIENMRGPRALNGPKFGGALQYAYHVDAGKLADFLSEVTIARGVRHLRDDVAGVQLDERGYIESLQLKRNGKWPVELVIDCTGFKGLFINQALGEPFESFSDYLLNDRALPIQVKHKNPAKIESVTNSTALEAGWSWRIPLHSRIGTGYVYSSRFKSDDEVLDEFNKFLGDEEQITQPRVLKMRVGRCRRSWVKNCVAIGLSSGFLEPLESTAIMSVELQARWLLYSMPTTDYEEPLSVQFNSACTRLYDEIRDFLGLHFSQSNRDDTPYWKAVRHEAKKSDALKEHLTLWKYALPSPMDNRDSRVFNHWSVACILMGKDFYKSAKLNDAELVKEDVWRNYCRGVREKKQTLLNRLANHRNLIDHMRSQAIPGESVNKTSKRLADLVNLGASSVAAHPVMAATGQ